MAIEPMPSESRRGGARAGLAAVVTAGGALGACAVCCTLPIAMPAVALGLFGSGVAALGVVHRAATLAGLLVVSLAWAWVWWDTRRTGRRPARATLRLMGAATVILALVLAWPVVERLVLAAIR